jgi:hypothetical protein
VISGLRPKAKPKDMGLGTLFSTNTNTSLSNGEAGSVVGGGRSRNNVDTSRGANPTSENNRAGQSRRMGGGGADKPALTQLCEMLLTWKFDNVDGSRGPSSNGGGRAGGRGTPTQEFCNIDEYISHWLPLTVNEIKASAVSNLQAAVSGHTVSWNKFLVSGDVIIDQPTVDSQDGQRIPLSFLKCNEYGMDGGSKPMGPGSGSKKELMGMDLVLLCHQQLSYNELCQLIESRPITPSFALALITSSSRFDGLQQYSLTMCSHDWDSLLLIRNTLSAKGRAVLPSGSSTASLVLEMTYLDSLVSGWREFIAVSSLKRMNQSVLTNQLLGRNVPMLMPSTPPSSPRIEDVDAERPPVLPSEGVQYAKILTDHLNLNSSQHDAVLLGSGLTCQGFSLVQGPPGTGKTTTLIGIVNSIHLNIYAQFYTSLVDAALGRAGLYCRQQIAVANDPITPWMALYNEVLTTKERMLIAAPSNIAVDNIVSRVLERGFLDGSGNTYKPSILRIGAGKSNSFGSSSAPSSIVSLEETMEREIMSSLSLPESKAAIERILQNMHVTAAELYAVHSYLLTLKDAFKIHLLPPGFELRVDVGTGRPYWVDHNNRATSFEPPSASSISSASATNSSVYFTSVHTLPEYIIHIKSFTRLLNDLYKSHLTLTRFKARLDGVKPGSDASSGRHALPRESRAAIESSIIESCDIICTTLNSAGHNSLSGMKFQICIVDEAAQATEPSLLIALSMSCKHCILIGDCNQLPATVFSQSAKNAGYDVSLFERLLKSRHPFVLLNQQYRMHPMISAFPSNMFYDGKVLDGPNVTASKYGLSMLQSSQDGNQVPLFRPCMYFNLTHSQDTKKAVSMFNQLEAQLCVDLVRELVKEAQGWGCWQCGRAKSGEDVYFAEALTVGIISPYADQVNEIRKLIKRANLPSMLKFPNRSQLSDDGNRIVTVPFEVDVNTVDGFQGKEKDIIIFSCVRANESGTIGFLSDFRRLNVALTRARFGLFVVGNSNTLMGNNMWKSYVEYAKVILMEVVSVYFLLFGYSL